MTYLSLKMKEDFPHKIEASWRASLKDAENDDTGVTCQFGPIKLFI